MSKFSDYLRFALFVALSMVFQSNPAKAHPHVFVDGGIDFVMGENNRLEALKVTWLIDEFETLFILSSYGLSLNDRGALDEVDRLELIEKFGDWPEDFQGSAHLTKGSANVALELPTGLDMRFVDGRIMATFTRKLVEPIQLETQGVEVAFYEATYYYAFFIKNEPKFLAKASSCKGMVIPFVSDTQLVALQTTLFELSREEKPGQEDVGALFADRIEVRCE